MQEKFSMEWNMEWKIFSMEWKKIASMEYGKIVFHSIPCLVTRPIASKFGTNMQLPNLKLLSKFHVAISNRSRVISKSLKFRTD